ncbi:DUF1707 SHOCT-like domain-containing protein [Nocardioides zhouii]|uniref:DUF1707 domain-containing protein n=1 Tax=Nocardioides zhouii TaxID=1168729 RepID=A0A4V1RNV8_9ACTN|nr:DUF1707 domain-containing protein [Nocardioides zhouii]RYC07207.1 DUF1707 domain-containing protein [Nocardioides zhouii]
MSGFRAKDADRDRYVDILESAYVDGQLGEQDRELRVGRALTAETLDELDALIRDLQNQPSPVVVRRTPGPVIIQAERAALQQPAAPPEPMRWPAPPRTGMPPRLVGFVVAGVLGLSVLALAPSSQDDFEPLYPQQDYSQLEEVPDISSAGGYELADADVRRFLRRYQGKFDTTDAYEVTFFDIRVEVHVPVGGSQPRFEVWSWDGGWRRDAAAQPVTGSAATVDLGTLDVQQLFENAEVARRDLGVSDARVQRVEVRPTPDAVGSVTIHVRNGSSDKASLESTPQGSQVRALPNEG